MGPNSNTNTNGTEFAVAGVTIHPTWDIGVLNINTRVNLAILKLARSISDPINVATVNTDPAVPFPDQTLMILGYGQLSTGTYPSQLAGGLLKYQSDCRGFYNTTLNVCAEAYPGNNQIACTGDMGGPVLAVGTNTLVGVQSFVFPSDCDLTTTNGYARVSYSGASEWIRRTICTVSSNPPGYCNTPAPTTMAPSSSPTVSLAPSEAPSSIPDGGKNCALRNTVKAVRNSVTSLYQNMFG